MVAEILSIFSSIFSNAFSWLGDFFVDDIRVLFLSFFTIFIVYRFVLGPLLKGSSAGSDKVRSKKDD